MTEFVQKSISCQLLSACEIHMVSLIPEDRLRKTALWEGCLLPTGFVNQPPLFSGLNWIRNRSQAASKRLKVIIAHGSCDKATIPEHFPNNKLFWFQVNPVEQHHPIPHPLFFSLLAAAKRVCQT